ncbi:hybrid sensor histidine kinase/response regulator [Flagellimonas aquimarina]|uniref:histidine kinase n=1 Tax=Flagellimonas aquimarina TaxID=2201895 RepID=A0A316L0X6_9FLAO|nr:ATP-binding protein [Allomuricauda koreensis]PWL40177.1 hybrid sensor histidine kinase/response regulator [Allomuricauda koreensis]
MYPTSKRRFTLKIISSYLVLGIVALLASVFIYSEFKNYNASQNKEEDNIKLLKTNSLLTDIYEAENLSKLALQSKKRSNLKAYAQKVDSIFNSIDSLKLLTTNGNQVVKLDSVQKLLQQKVYNNAELRKLKVKNENSAPIDSLLKKFNKMEVDLGRITPETFVPNFEQLSPEVQKSIREYVAILNKNIPKDPGEDQTNAGIDSVLQLSKSILEQAKTKNAKIERSLIEKELQIYKADLELSQKLRSMISAFEQEIIMSAYQDNLNKQKVLKTGTQLTVAAVIIGFLFVCLFTFLITKDFWKVQQYRQQLEKEKKYSESLLKSREQLISTVSHDLRTPLNTISGYTELMEHSKLDGKQLQYLKNVKSASKYVDDLVNDLLDFSKLEAGRIQVEKVPYVLSHLVLETASNFQEVHHKKNIELKLEIAEELGIPIVGDPFRVRQILTNLLGNAFKFTHSGYVKVKAITKEIAGEPFIDIMVIDTGIGIEQEKQELIFKEFTQAGDSIEKKYGGYGLGLTISKKLAQLLEATLHLESKENEGSVFTLSLPLEFSNTEIPFDKPKQSSFKHNLSLLIFDDDETLLGLLGEVCQMHAITTRAFSSFEDLDNIGDFQYDIVLTDIQMPTIDGFEVIKNLQNGNYSHYKNQPIIAMTGQKDLDKSVYTEAGFSEVIQKPFSRMTLLDALSSTLNSSKPYPFGHPILNTTQKSNSKLFSVETISSFLDSSQGIHEVLDSFLENTVNNMNLLSIAIENRNYDGVKSISHKMLPMFRQLKVDGIIPILEKFEHMSDDCMQKKTVQDLEKLKLSISNLEEAIRSFLTTLPVDID